MKSQDILLLLKLLALERQAHVSPTTLGAPPADVAAAVNAQYETLEEPTAAYSVDRKLDPYSVRGLSNATGISKSEISNALARCYANGLAKQQRGGTGPVVNRRDLKEFLAYGIRFVFPVQASGLVRGTPTGLTAPIFEGILRSAGELPPVWPNPQDDTLGLAVEPLYKTVTVAVRNDRTLYKLLATVDSIRLGQPRERKLAITQLHELMSF